MPMVLARTGQPVSVPELSQDESDRMWAELLRAYMRQEGGEERERDKGAV